MKNRMLVFISLAAVIGIFYSCKKSNPSTPSSSMIATVKGTTWTATTISDNTSASGGDTILYIIGSNAAGQRIQIDILNYHSATGTYNFADIPHTCAAYFYKDSVNYSQAASGQLVLSTVNSNSIQGTFNFTTSDTTTVTAGSFTAGGL